MSDDFREGIIALNTRNFGEAVELIVQLLTDYQDSDKLEFDLYSPDTNEKIEVKASRVLERQRLDLTLDNMYEKIVNKSNRDRLITQSQATDASIKFNCNIQQIKVKWFDKLYYLLLFYDVIEIFIIDKTDIKQDKHIGYSDKQHRGNVGEGQFHITPKNYQHHKDKYFKQVITYEKIRELLLARSTAKNK